MQAKLGATLAGDGRVRFLVWAPQAGRIDLHLSEPRERLVEMERDARGYHHLLTGEARPGSRYFYRLDGKTERPDPASRFQPQGVHGPSEVVDPSFPWEDRCWFGLPLEDYITYELHVGVFTPEGTLDAVIPHLNDLRELGVTAVELMPVAQFPGERNWGYDGVYPFAVQNSYGGPAVLQRLADACHVRGMALVLDVVYNHFGPEGNYAADFAPYFTDRYRTPWGQALNFDGPESDEVRRYFVENAVSWFTDYHIDALRLDAVHAILDHSAYPFLQQLADAIRNLGRRLNRQIYLIPESSDNDRRLVLSPDRGGYGLHAQWNDDFHHCLHTLLTSEQSGYYQDYGRMADLAKAFREGFVYSGQYSLYRRRRHGTSSADIPSDRLVVFSQNHDQVGNRVGADRLGASVCFEALKLAAGLVLFSPFLPLLFMGEEYGETAPFPYFISHSDPALVTAVREGRRREFAAFEWAGEPPDPQDERTFRSARLDHDLRREGNHRVLRECYREMIRLRKTLGAFGNLARDRMQVDFLEAEKVLIVHRWDEEGHAVVLANLGNIATTSPLRLPPGRWQRVFASDDPVWNGPGSHLPETIDIGGPAGVPLGPESMSVIYRGDLM